MNAVRICLAVVVAAGVGLVNLSGCSESSTENLGKVDVNQLPPAEQIFEFASSGNLDKLKALIGADATLVSARGNHDWTPLHFAAANGQNAVVKFLVANGADLRAADENSYTPIAIAAQRSHQDTVKLLKEATPAAPESN